jgi:hypothetical protein
VPYVNSFAGFTYVIFGKRTGWGAPSGNLMLNTGYGNLIDGTYGIRFDGVTANNQAGYSVATGDVNGDGIADLIIGANGGNGYAGYTYTVFGNSAILPSTTALTGTTNSTSLSLISYNDIMQGQTLAANGIPAGTTIVSCGGTVCTGALTLSNPATVSAGTAVTVATTPLNIGTGTLINGTAGARFDGPAANYDSGSGVATGDINGDGIPDLIIGAFGVNSYAGAVYIYNGRMSGWPNPNNYGGAGYPLGGL